MKFRKQSVGVDISKDSFDVKFLALPVDSDRFKIRGSRKFSNTYKGIKSFHQWLNKKAEPGTGLIVVMEATGTYHEELAYYLYDHDYPVSIQLPNKVKAFARSHNELSKTDLIDAKLIALLGLERSLRNWQPASVNMRQLRHLTRERQAIMQDRLRHANRLHALDHSHKPNRSTIKRHQASIKMLERQITAIEKEINQLRKQDTQLDTLMSRLQTIPQVGALTAATVVAETAGFDLFESRAQVVKYAGMDIIARQSGSSVLGKSRLSKRGNSRLRGALHMPAIGTINRTGPIAEIFTRVHDRTKCKMKAVVAVQRKLLVIMYSLTKNEKDYDEQVHRQRTNRVGEPGGSPTVTLLAEADWS